MVVVDEEHDASFKQEDPAPRYHGRDAAMVLAATHGSRVVLGSATPSMESWYLATTGKFCLVRLEERYGGIHLPQIHLVDLLAEKRANTLKGELSGALCTAIQKRLDRQEQIILLQNRRGYAIHRMRRLWLDAGLYRLRHHPNLSQNPAPHGLSLLRFPGHSRSCMSRMWQCTAEDQGIWYRKN
jgi:hypothetical protein